MPESRRLVPDAELYRNLAEDSFGLMCVHDLEGFLLWVNLAAADSLGFSIENGIGRNLREFLAAGMRPLFDRYLERIRSARVDTGLMRLQAHDGSERIWLYRNALAPAGDRVFGHGLDVTDRVRAERALKESEERLRTLFEEAPVAYVDIDTSAVIRRLNRAGKTMLRCSDWYGRSLWDFIVPDERPRAQADFEQAIAGATPSYRSIYRFSAGSAGILSIELCLNFSSDRHGRIAGANCALLDLTERLRAEDQIRSMNTELETRVQERTAELQRSNTDLQQFALVVSHDLQTPLRQLRSLLEGMTYPGVDAPALVERSRANVDRMSRLTSRLLEYALVAHGPARPARTVDVAATIRESIANLESDIRDSGATVHFESMPSVVAEYESLVQVFQNLIGNAIKYHRPDVPPQIRIRAERTDSEWLIRVEDNGLGIEPGSLDNVFTPFRRLHGSGYPGAGVGLAICRRVLERNGGRIWVESEPGAGSVFSFTLPV